MVSWSTSCNFVQVQTDTFYYLLSFSSRVCPAEDLPFEDDSVDLVTAFAAVHWFDGPRFLREVDRVLKPSGCVVFSSYNRHMQLCYKDCTDELTEIFREVSPSHRPRT
ncbi:putative methyltransferase DDB_G0268948 isoform X1 [Podarcis lilfordi]|uniref:Methyltransferase DDB_G0268948 isoform X1 n=1 Tax=Podarcis lilfordi TaxID=74358 RepID=A0AA35LEU0_9SAUR|nr:putative methyltransferase DDB_G0268948 isoform X1 [Podarcis lilfordi]